MPLVMQLKKDLSELSGNRKRIDSVDAVRYPRVWPKAAVSRLEAFNAWKVIAMRLLHANKASFRLMCVYPDAMSWENGEVWSSDEDLANLAGGCGTKTISREVALYKSLGLIMVERGWRDRAGKLVATRKIRMALPKFLPADIANR